MHFRERGKTVAPYVVGGTKISLDVLSKATTLINPPCVGVVIGVLSQIITIIEGVKANRDDMKTLVERLLGLLVVISDSYRGTSDDDLTMDVRTSVQRLSGQLDIILKEVKEMQAATDPRTIRGFIKGGLLYFENGQKIKEYAVCINWAMDTFQVEGRIQDAIHLRVIRAEVSDMHADFRDMHATVNDMHAGVKEIRGALENVSLGSKAQDIMLLPSSILPSQPTVLYGRDDEVSNIVGRVVSTASPRLAILGPGGIGKTAVLLAVKEHPDIEQRFGDSRFFVRCEQATSPALFIELIAKSLHIENSSNDRMEDIRIRLRSNNQPTLLLLDNFETPWDIPEEQTTVEEILSSLTSFPHVAILITMRSNVPPSTNISWSRPWLEPLPVLSKEAAHDLYVTIDPEAASDHSLDALLAELSYMPLAITLMASLGRTGETPIALLKAWKNKAIGADLLHGTDKNKSVNISIRLSIESNLMRSVPEALILLSVIAMLPAGANVALLPNLLPSIQNLILAKGALRRAALTNPEAGSQTLQVLSPIRAYVLKYHPLSTDLREALHDAYIAFIAEHASDIGHENFVNDAKALGDEESNLEVILPDAIQLGSDRAIDGAITFCTYQLNTRPRLEVIQNLVKVCRQKNELHQLARSLYCLGRILFRLGLYEEARGALEGANQTFVELGDRLHEADCLKSLGDVHHIQGRYDEARVAFQQADRIYSGMGNRLGVANCLSHLGEVHRMQDRYDEARAAFQQADKTYSELGDRLGVAYCLQSLGDIHQIQGRYDEARATFRQADRTYSELGNRLGEANCLTRLANIHYMQDQYDEAQATFQQADQIYSELDDRLGAADCLQSLGDIHRIQGRYDEAETAFQQADRTYSELGDPFGTAGCLESLGNVHWIQGRYDEARTTLQQASQTYSELGDRLGVANCLWSLGEVHRIQGRYDEARAAFRQADQTYTELGVQSGMANCLRSIGEMDDQNDEQDLLKMIHEEFGRDPAAS
ncbi:hypothetical protein FRB93_001942 [Tulasnella sp. JGI-2019a]|nr:hypothetical protein FRB93_001942 [Tulasnella sp. JGI-2019a]